MKGKPREQTSGALAGKTFVLTGSLSVPRAEAKKWIEAAGGKVVLVPLVPGLSSTNLIEKMRESEEPS